MFETGWLKKIMTETSDLMKSQKDAYTLSNYGIREDLPIDKEAASRLFDILNNRFFSWTGKTLIEYVKDNFKDE